MNEVIFEINSTLEMLEQNNNWNEALTLLYNNWLHDKSNINSLLRISSECWYILVEWDHNNMEQYGCNYCNILKILSETYKFAVDNYKSNPKINYVFGYMISLFPELFFVENDCDYEKYENMGKEMLKFASTQEPGNSIYLQTFRRCLMTLNSVPNQDYLLIHSKVKKEINKYIKGNSAIDTYFKDVLTQDI